MTVVQCFGGTECLPTSVSCWSFLSSAVVQQPDAAEAVSGCDAEGRWASSWGHMLFEGDRNAKKKLIIYKKYSLHL